MTKYVKKLSWLMFSLIIIGFIGMKPIQTHAASFKTIFPAEDEKIKVNGATFYLERKYHECEDTRYDEYLDQYVPCEMKLYNLCMSKNGKKYIIFEGTHNNKKQEDFIITDGSTVYYQVYTVKEFNERIAGQIYSYKVGGNSKLLYSYKGRGFSFLGYYSGRIYGAKYYEGGENISQMGYLDVKTKKYVKVGPKDENDYYNTDQHYWCANNMTGKLFHYDAKTKKKKTKAAQGACYVAKYGKYIYYVEVQKKYMKNINAKTMYGLNLGKEFVKKPVKVNLVRQKFDGTEKKVIKKNLYVKYLLYHSSKYFNYKNNKGKVVKVKYR